MTFRVEVARDSCFCPGVRRAFQMTIEMLLGHEKSGAYSVGPLIHNRIVVSMLEEMGLVVIDPQSGDLPPMEGVPTVIRSHGIDYETEELLRSTGAKLYDATCPKVKRVQNEAAQLAADGYMVIVAGSPEHPEVQSIVGRTEGDVFVINNIERAREWVSEMTDRGRAGDKVGIVCQTTRSKEFLEAVAREIRKAFSSVVVKDTTCESVSQRLVDTLSLARLVDVMIVVGGRNSSNTSHLVSICVDAGVRTYWIEDASEIKTEWLIDISSVGVTGGASTPDWIIDEVAYTLNSIAEET
ncbi:MAG: 4-hydroxy-3-methylbut-2-enyl diphosphate reductase [Actinobacteria bacterium]|nr:4-hydroxy-3-methylbut-2-enyl diphosphate reductase [Actinomycetota bacterium]